MRFVVSNWVRVLALSGLILGLSPTPGAVAEPPLAGDMIKFVASETPVAAPETPFISADGESIKLADFSGKLVLMNFWATWCAPCIRELPAIDNLRAAVTDQDLEILLVSIDRGGAKVHQPFLEKLGVRNLKSASDPKAGLLRALKAPGIPVTVLIGRDGNVIGRLIGDAHWDAPEAVALVNYYLDQGK